MIKRALKYSLVLFLAGCVNEPVHWGDVSYRQSQLGDPDARSAVMSANLPVIAGASAPCIRSIRTAVKLLGEGEISVKLAVTVHGALPGDVVTISFVGNTAPPGGSILVAEKVTAADSVRVEACNPTNADTAATGNVGVRIITLR